MSTNKDLDRIKKVLSAMPKGKRRRFTPELRRLIGRYARDRVAEGASRRAVASELGVGDRTLSQALNAASTETWVPVRVTAESPSSVRVHGPGGLLIDGLNIEGIAALIRALS